MTPEARAVWLVSYLSEALPLGPEHFDASLPGAWFTSRFLNGAGARVGPAVVCHFGLRRQGRSSKPGPTGHVPDWPGWRGAAWAKMLETLKDQDRCNACYQGLYIHSLLLGYNIAFLGGIAVTTLPLGDAYRGTYSEAYAMETKRASLFGSCSSAGHLRSGCQPTLKLVDASFGGMCMNSRAFRSIYVYVYDSCIHPHVHPVYYMPHICPMNRWAPQFTGQDFCFVARKLPGHAATPGNPG